MSLYQTYVVSPAFGKLTVEQIFWDSAIVHEHDQATLVDAA